jgi:hypothetical protein
MHPSLITAAYIYCRNGFIIVMTRSARKKRPILKVDEATKELLKSEVYRLQKEEHCTLKQIQQKTGLANRTVIRYLADMKNRIAVNEAIIQPSKELPESKRHRSRQIPIRDTPVSNPQFDPPERATAPQLNNANPDDVMARFSQSIIEKAMASDDPRWATILLSVLKEMKVIKPPEQQVSLQIPKYYRPSILNPTQHEIIDAIADTTTKIVFVEGSRRVGKSTAAFLGICECILSGRLKWDMWASKGDACKRLHRDMIQDRLTADCVKEIIAQTISNKTTWYNGGQLCLHDTTVADSKGIGGDGIFIDEFDQMLLHNREVFAAIIGILRDKANMKVVLVANRDSGIYKLFREVLKQEAEITTETTPAVKFFTLTSQESPHIQTAGNDALISKLMTVSMGQAYTAQALYNRESHEGETFNSVYMSKAFMNFDEWALLYAPNHYHVMISIDPGFNHATGIVVLAISEDLYDFDGTQYHQMWELHSEGKEGNDYNDFNSSVVECVCGWARKCAQHTGCTRVEITTESNNSGLVWKQQIANRGYSVITDNFGRPDWWTSKLCYCDAVNYYLCAQMIHLRNPDLKAEMTIFTTKENADDEHKGNMCDALLHAVFLGAGGPAFVQHMAELKKEASIPSSAASSNASSLIYRK